MKGSFQIRCFATTKRVISNNNNNNNHITVKPFKFNRNTSSSSPRPPPLKKTRASTFTSTKSPVKPNLKINRKPPSTIPSTTRPRLVFSRDFFINPPAYPRTFKKKNKLLLEQQLEFINEAAAAVNNVQPVSPITDNTVNESLENPEQLELDSLKPSVSLASSLSATITPTSTSSGLLSVFHFPPLTLHTPKPDNLYAYNASSNTALLLAHASDASKQYSLNLDLLRQDASLLSLDALLSILSSPHLVSTSINNCQPLDFTTLDALYDALLDRDDSAFVLGTAHFNYLILHTLGYQRLVMGRTRDQLKGDEVGLDQEIGSGAAASLKAFHYEEILTFAKSNSSSSTPTTTYSSSPEIYNEIYSRIMSLLDDMRTLSIPMDGITYSLLIHAAAITHPSSFSVSAHGASLSASSEADKQHRFMFAEDLVDEYYTEAGSMGLKLTADAYVVVVEQACVAHRAYLDAQEIAGRLKSPPSTATTSTTTNPPPLNRSKLWQIYSTLKSTGHAPPLAFYRALLSAFTLLRDPSAFRKLQLTLSRLAGMKEYAKFYAHDKWGTCGLYASMLEALAEVGGEERVLNRVMFLLRAQRLAVDGPILHALMKYWVYTHKPKAALRLQRYLQDPVQNSSNINSSSGSNHGKVKPNHHTYSLLGDACLMVGDQELYEVTVVRRLALSLFETYKPQHQQLENDHQPHLLVVTATPPRFSGRLGMNTWEFVVAGLIRLVKETNMAVDVRPELFDQTKKMTVSSALLKSPSSSSLPLALLPPPVSFSAKNLVVDGQEPVEEEVEATSPTSVATTATTIIDPLLSASVSLENTVLSTRDIVEIVLHMANHSTIVFPRSPVPHATDYSENTNNQEYTPQFKTIRELASMLGAAGDITSFERLMTGYVFPLSSVSSSASSSALTSSTLVKWDDQIKKSLMDDNNDAATSSSTTSTASSDTSTSLVETVHETLFLAFVESWVEANAAARRLNQTSSVARRQRGRDEKDENEGSEVQGEEAVVDVERQLMIAARIKALRTSALQL